MKQQIKHFRALNKWFKTPLGMIVAKEFTRELKLASEYVHGETLVQLASCGSNEWLQGLHFTHKWIASPFSIKESNHFECSLNHLPLGRSVIDCVIAPLTLEAFAGDVNLLDEIDRILKPMGHIIFLGINPWSLWGAALKTGYLDCYNDRHTKMSTPTHINRVFTQRGYVQRNFSNFCYIPPINKQGVINKLTFLDEVGRMLWPFPSGIYCYIAQKYEYIEPSFMLKPVAEMIPAGFNPVIS